MNKAYKAGRKPPRLNRHSNDLTEEQQYENRVWQQTRTIEYLNETPIIQFYVPLVEADDVISYVKSLEVYHDWEKIIVSSDKDFIQVLDESTLLYRPTQSEVLNKNRVVDKFGIHPNNFALARAMVGDSSDNLPGVARVGLGTVAKRFPLMAEEQEVYLDYIIEECKKPSNSKLKVFQSILESQRLIKSNYQIMQLSSPQISIQSKEKIRNTCTNHEPLLNKTELVKHMTKDGFGEVSLSDLYETFYRICTFHNKKES